MKVWERGWFFVVLLAAPSNGAAPSNHRRLLLKTDYLHPRLRCDFKHTTQRLRGGARFDENKAVEDVIQKNTPDSKRFPPTAFENLVASTLFQAQLQSDKLRVLKYLHIVSAREVLVSKDFGVKTKAAIMMVPYVEIDEYRKVWPTLLPFLENAVGSNIFVIAHRRILPREKRGKVRLRQKRPQSRTKAKVYEAYLEDMLWPFRVTGFQTRFVPDEDEPLYEVFLNPEDRAETDWRLPSYSAVYRSLTGRIAEFGYWELPEGSAYESQRCPNIEPFGFPPAPLFPEPQPAEGEIYPPLPPGIKVEDLLSLGPEAIEAAATAATAAAAEAAAAAGEAEGGAAPAGGFFDQDDALAKAASANNVIYAGDAGSAAWMYEGRPPPRAERRPYVSARDRPLILRNPRAAPRDGPNATALGGILGEAERAEREEAEAAAAAAAAAGGGPAAAGGAFGTRGAFGAPGAWRGGGRGRRARARGGAFGSGPALGVKRAADGGAGLKGPEDGAEKVVGMEVEGQEVVAQPAVPA